MFSGVNVASLKSLTFGALFMDYDLDGLLDIFAANGHVADDISVLQPTLKYEEAPLMFHNKGNGKFEDVTRLLGPALRRAVVGRGAAYGPARLLRNDNANQNDMLRVKTVGTRSNRDGIGAKITLKTNTGLRQFAMVHDGSSYLSQSELPVTFGLGKPADGKTVSLEILWPSGRKDSIADIQPNQFITVQEGKGVVSAQPIVFTPAAARTGSAR
jgi:hypothetical protein